MTSREEVVSNFTGMLRQYQPAQHYYPGYLGETDATDAPVYTARENYLWVRYPYSNSQAVPVLCVAANVPKVAGYKVTVGKLPWMTQDQILWPGDARADGVSATDTAVTPGTTVGYTAYPSAANFAYLSSDPIYVNWRQITPLGVFPLDNASMNVQIWAGYIPRTGGAIFVNNQTLDLTSHIPVSGARYSLISFDSVGNAVVTDGSINSGGFSALTAADIPSTPAGNWRSCAVVLYAGQTAVVETRNEIDFWDLRFPEEKPAGSVSPSSIPLTNTHILVGNVSNVATDVAMSSDATIANTGALTIANQAVTYAKMQNISAAQRALGRNTAGAGSAEEITATQLIDWIGSTRGSILYRGASGWSILAPGTLGYVLTSNGSGADPAYQPVAQPVGVYNETVSSNGIATTYYLSNYAAPGTIRVFVNGIRQPATDDTVATDIVNFTTAPEAGLLIFDYELELV